MADLSTTYLGLNLRSPLVPSASPLSAEIDNIKRMEDAGAAAVVLYSLFEEQLTQVKIRRDYAERGLVEQAAALYPTPDSYRSAPDAYLAHIRRAKEVVAIPVIASINCTSVGGWAEYAKQMQQAGADAIELNIYYVPTDPFISGSQVERSTIQIVEDVRSNIHIPLAVKLGPYYSSVAYLAWKLEQAGADALVLFNRFYQPDFNLERMQVTPRILLSTPQAMRLPLRWISILCGRLHLDFAATSGIHEAYDAAKMIFAGASATMLCSVLLKRGIGYLRVLEQGLGRWMDEHQYGSITEMQGKLSQSTYPDPEAFERAHYIRNLLSYSQATPDSIVSPQRKS